MIPIIRFRYEDRARFAVESTIQNQLNTFTNFEVNFPLRESFQSELRKNYGSEIAIVPVDFTNRPRTTLRRMNGFIAKNTNNLIRDMFKQPVSPDNKVEANSKGFLAPKGVKIQCLSI